MQQKSMGERLTAAGRFCLNSFYRAPSIYIFLCYLILMSSYFSKVYAISGHLYLLVVPLFLLGLALYFIYSRLPRRALIRIGAILLPLLLLLAVYLIKREFFNDLIERYYIKNTDRLQEQIFYSIETDYLQFAPFVVPLIPLLTILFLFLDRRGQGGYFILLTVAVMLGLSYIGFEEDLTGYLLGYFFLTALYLSVNSYNRIRLRSKRSSHSISLDNRIILNYTAVAVVVLLSITFSLPWLFSLDKIKKTAFTLSSHMVTEDSFDLKSVGYSGNNTRLGGEIRPNNKIVMKVKADSDYYLRGMVKDYYNGYLWLTTASSFSGKPLDPAYFREQEEQFTPREIRLYPSGLKVFSFFTPLNSYDIEYRWARYRESGENTFKAADDQTVSASYKVHFFDSTGQRGDNSADEVEFALTYKPVTYRTDTPLRYAPELQNYRHHLQLPTTISVRTYNLFYKLLRECKTDEEKLTKIREYLVENYSYNMEVSDLPEERDFVDYFLFEEREGYCTYFASAATIFCRVAGIPARYVEGFRMLDNRDDSGFYKITNNMAHAWTEVLIDPEHNIWAILDCTPEDYMEIGTIPTYTAYPDYLNRYMNQEALQAEFKRESPVEQQTTERFSIMKGLRSKRTLSLLISALIAVLSAIVALLLLLVALQVLLFFRVKARVLGRPGVLDLYDYSKRRLKAVDILFSAYKTDEENLSIIDDSFMRTMMGRLVKAYQDEYFGDKIDNSFSKRRFFNYLEGKIRKELGLLGYLRSCTKGSVVSQGQ